MNTLSAQQAKAFARDGFVIQRGMANADLVKRLRETAQQQLDEHIAPVEYEADVGYPGAPPSRDDDGGRTIRRLHNAYARDDCFREWAGHSEVVGVLQDILAEKQVLLSQAHHNCIMTKQPGFSSETNWHQDIRYWAFDRPELVSVWLALGSETKDNGCLWLLPGSHRWELEYNRFDDAKFLRKDLTENEPLLKTAVAAELQAGDVLFFHAKTFHAAGRNRAEQTKFSLVFTYHGPEVHAEPGTRSAHAPEICLA